MHDGPVTGPEKQEETAHEGAAASDEETSRPGESSGRSFSIGSSPFVPLLIAALMGTFATGFLSYRHILIETDPASIGNSVLCRADGTVDCDAVLLTEYSKLFGHISSAVLGLSGFVFVLWCLINGLTNRRIRKAAWICLLGYFFTAIGFSWYFIYLMIFEVEYVCPWCLVVHAMNLCSLILLVVYSLKFQDEFLLPEISSLAERAYFVAGGVLVSLVVLFAAGAVEKTLCMQAAEKRYETLAKDPVVVVAKMNASPAREIPVTEEDPVFGQRSAPYELVLFSDFACPVCAGAEAFLQRFVARNPGVLKLVQKTYPLSTECNRAVLEDLHPMGCHAARAAHAAFILGGDNMFWTFGKLLFAFQGELKNAPWLTFAKKLDLDEARFRELMKPGSEADKKIMEDIELGIKLKLKATPELYFQKKKVPDDCRGIDLVRVLQHFIRTNYPDKKDLKLTPP